MLLKRNQTTKKQIAKRGIVWDYPMPSEDVGFSLQDLNSRVPDEGWYKNKVCDEICFVISGSATLFIDDKKFNVKQGDVFFIKPNQKSYLIAKKLKILTVTRPNWYEEQCELVKE